ncbi:MAG: MmgE/PrpD family protein [Pseudonocardiaceae bacterium]|nr:MmgE/PrpD family protein [Pseudonocardiaceae bacterium]
MTTVPTTRLLARHAVRARGASLPPPTADAATAVFLDWCAVTIGGSRTAPAEKLRQALAGHGGVSQLVGATGGAEPTVAALINGTAAHALELDDIYAPGLYHPGAPTVAAALAVADKEGASGERLLRGITIGFEIGNRVARTLGPAHYAYWHTTGTAGSLSAAAAVAEILSLDTEPFAHALALAATMAAGLQQTFRADSMGKPLHSGHAAQAGVIAGLSAAAGFTGTLDVLDGEIGMGVAMSDSPSWHVIDAAFGPDYLIQSTTVKPYSCCGHTFAAIDAALELRERGIGPHDVATIEVESYAAALTVAGNPGPSTPFEAKFSIPFVVAYALREGHPGTEAFHEATLEAPEIRKLMAAVRLHDGHEFTEAFPARRGARVVIVDPAGKHHRATVPDRRGDPENPLTPEQLDTKFLSLVDGVVGAGSAVELQRRIRSVREITDVRKLRIGPGDT